MRCMSNSPFVGASGNLDRKLSTREESALVLPPDALVERTRRQSRVQHRGHGNIHVYASNASYFSVISVLLVCAWQQARSGILYAIVLSKPPFLYLGKHILSP